MVARTRLVSLSSIIVFSRCFVVAAAAAAAEVDPVCTYHHARATPKSNNNNLNNTVCRYISHEEEEKRNPHPILAKPDPEMNWCVVPLYELIFAQPQPHVPLCQKKFHGRT